MPFLYAAIINGGDSKIRTYSPERTVLQTAATLPLRRISIIHLVRVENFEISTLWLKARYSASELHPHVTICLVLSCKFSREVANSTKPMQLY